MNPPKVFDSLSDTVAIDERRSIAVIIPFFQKEEGILRRAVLSIFGQSLPSDVSVHVFIIDDSSPLPPQSDLVDLPTQDQITWSVHQQPNAGPGAARNRGLDLADASKADFVAFLDSDDEWLPQHLSDALAALDQGYDCYFCDHSRSGFFDSYSESIPCLANKGRALLQKSKIIDPEGPVLGFFPQTLINEILGDYLCQTSSVVVKRRAIESIRYHNDLRSAGEDHLFWLELFSGSAPVAISWRINTICGSGINMYFSAYDWNSASSIERVGNRLIMTEIMAKHIDNVDIADIDRGILKRERRKMRRGYSFLLIRGTLKGIRPSGSTLLKVLRYDPFFLIRAPFFFGQVLVSKDPETKKW